MPPVHPVHSVGLGFVQALVLAVIGFHLNQRMLDAINSRAIAGVNIAFRIRIVGPQLALTHKVTFGAINTEIEHLNRLITPVIAQHEHISV